MGEFSDRRWQAAVKKLLAREYAVASITAQTPASPNEQIWLTTHVNPPGTDDGRVSGTVEVMASLSYLQRLIAFPDRVEALPQLGIAAWNGIDGGRAYGYANLAISPPRAMFPQWSAQGPGAPLPWESIKAPAERAHPIPQLFDRGPRRPRGRQASAARRAGGDAHRTARAWRPARGGDGQSTP
jgi:hypothetical protein